MGVVVFDYNAWAATYPALAATVDAPTATGYFVVATGFLDNTDSSPVADLTRRTSLLYMLVAHVAVVFARDPSAVGRLSDVGEGTTKATLDMGETKGAQVAFFNQSQYGALYWAQTARFRRARYIPRC